MLERWDRLSPNEPHLISHQKAILCSSQRPDQGLSPVWEPSSTPSLPALSSLPPWGRVPPQGPYSVLSSSAVSSVGCQRLRTWYQGLPLVHHPPCGVSDLTQTNTHPGLHGKHEQSSLVCPPRAPELWHDPGSSPLPSSPYTHGPWKVIVAFSHVAL